MCHLWNQDLPEEQADPPFVGPTQDLYLCFIFQGKTPMLGTLPVHLVDILGCGELGSMKEPRQSLFPLVVLKPCQGKLSEVCWLAVVLRPDICARMARTASWQRSNQLNEASILVWDDTQDHSSLEDVSKGKCMCLEEHAWNTHPAVGLLNMHSAIMPLLRLLDLSSYNTSMM